MIRVKKTRDGIKFRIGGTGMLSWILSGLLGAWVLSWFGFDDLCIKAVNELFGVQATTASYYFVFAILGLISGWISRTKKDDQENDF